MLCQDPKTLAGLSKLPGGSKFPEGAETNAMVRQKLHATRHMLLREAETNAMVRQKLHATRHMLLNKSSDLNEV